MASSRESGFVSNGFGTQADRSITTSGVLRGVGDLLATLPAVFLFGVGFGAAAASLKVQPEVALAMSALVFAGASQFAALDLWQAQLPILALLILTLAINARHLILGATLQPWLRNVPATRRFAVIALLSDANWASTQQAIARGEQDAGHLLGGGLALWIAWVFGTAVGAFAGGTIPDLERFGLDLLLPAFFACTLIGLAPRSSDWLPLAVAGSASVGALLLLPAHWAILFGTAAGGFAGWVIDAQD